MELSLSRIHFPVTALGPGNRIGIWFQGCSIHCPGCVSADTWSIDRGRTTVEDVLRAISTWLPLADGVTISGGEPFDQPDALLALLAGLDLTSTQDVLVYSGHPLERIAGVVERSNGRIDALISDPFEASSPQTLQLRGSDNQRLTVLTDRGHQVFAGYHRHVSEVRAMDLMFDSDGTVWLAGIPRQQDMTLLRQLLASQGHDAKTSALTLPKIPT
jgi:anaerobic ribonucleoside-triphosphate reductase activating protein